MTRPAACFADDNRGDLDAVSRAALAHAQFEAIHPYGDGNGRLGRVLVSRVLRRSGVTARSTAPISVAIARDPGGYLSGLRLFERGDHDPWVRWFAETERVGAQAVTLTSRYAGRMSELTGAERYLKDRRNDLDYDRAYTSARRRIDQVDSLIRALDERRCSLSLSKAELARRAGLRPEVTRRLFTAASPNPTLSTVVALAGALELELTTEPIEDSPAS